MTNSEQPDPDAIKMFVGQIPRSMDENDLRKMFEEFGKVHQINVLRDKTTNLSKDCVSASKSELVENERQRCRLQFSEFPYT
ncbi:hypothetical protein J437_LFUL003258 [Ladona fulva]|uniref:RRM domain-containing protein n=1 Tax=Ladona fulva TaxID=123851 RepID=A0A8K0NUM7_LADFU|nr:hypothetical protein J437_LFUL003258 [Ladona fulva]